MRPAFAICRPEQGEYSGGFEQLLRREKALYSLCTDKPEDPVTCFENVFPDWAYDYVKEGGVAVVSGAKKDTFAFDSGYLCKAGIETIDLTDFDQGKARIRSAVSVFAGEGKGELTLHENRTIKQGRRPGFYPVFLYHRLGKGCIIYTGVPVTEILTYEGSDLRMTTDLFDYDEHVSSVDKQKVAAALRDILMEAMHMAGHPYLSLWYFPDGAKSVFAYSIDGDGLLTEGLNNLLEVSKETDTRFVFYISKELCENDPELEEKLKAIAEHNILASHGGIHNAKDTYEENIEDIDILEDWMKSLDTDFVRSYAAPRGMYSHNLGKALKDKGYLHSRDFGFALDDYPYYPISEGEFDTVLQLPCDGFNVCRLMAIHAEKGMEAPSAEEIIDRYRKIMDQKMERKLPLLFFCHPQYFGLYAREVYPAIVKYAKEKGILLTDYVSYGDFWIARDACEYDADHEANGLHISVVKKDPQVRICIDGRIIEEDLVCGL